MKILHMADLHLGAKNSRLPGDKQQMLRDEIADACHRLFAEIKGEVDVVLICGDLFHKKNVPAKIAKSFFSAVSQFENPVLYIEGNHDDKFILPDDLPKNFVVLSERNDPFEYEDFVFYSKENLPQRLDQSKNNILLLHGNIETTADNDYVDINAFLGLEFDYIALGHIHQTKKYKKGEHIFAYPGSLFANGFDERGEKGYLEVEISDKQVTKCNFQRLKQRRFFVVDCDISGKNNTNSIYQAILLQFENAGVSTRDLVKVVLTGDFEEDCDKSVPLLQDKLSEYFYVEIEDKSNLKVDIEKIKKETLSLKYEFISLLEQDASLDADAKRAIVNLGIKALKGEDILL